MATTSSTSKILINLSGTIYNNGLLVLCKPNIIVKCDDLFQIALFAKSVTIFKIRCTLISVFRFCPLIEGILLIARRAYFYT